MEVLAFISSAPAFMFTLVASMENRSDFAIIDSAFSFMVLVLGWKLTGLVGQLKTY
jgi:hypothetical protein